VKVAAGVLPERRSTTWNELLLTDARLSGELKKTRSSSLTAICVTLQLYCVPALFERWQLSEQPVIERPPEPLPPLLLLPPPPPPEQAPSQESERSARVGPDRSRASIRGFGLSSGGPGG
jgi:hypothetical protein